MGTQAAQNWLLLANLVAVGAYVWLTRGIKKASLEQGQAANRQTEVSQGLLCAANEETQASRELVMATNEQSEGLAKPVIVVESSGVNCSTDAIVNGGLRSEIADAVRLINIGTGPALQIEWTATGQRLSGEPQCDGSARPVPYLRPAERLVIGWDRSRVSGVKIGPCLSNAGIPV